MFSSAPFPLIQRLEHLFSKLQPVFSLPYFAFTMTAKRRKRNLGRRSCSTAHIFLDGLFVVWLAKDTHGEVILSPAQRPGNGVTSRANFIDTSVVWYLPPKTRLFYLSELCFSQLISLSFSCRWASARVIIIAQNEWLINQYFCWWWLFKISLHYAPLFIDWHCFTDTERENDWEKVGRERMTKRMRESEWVQVKIIGKSNR